MSADVSGPSRAAAPPRVDDSARSALELIAEGVTELVGFDVAAISVVVDDQLEVVAVSGNESARGALQGSRTAISVTEDLLTQADDWGALRFVPHERASSYLSTYGWTPDYEHLDVEDAWHAEDMLFAPFHSSSGAIQGLLAVDLPSDGLRPGPLKRNQLERYAVQAGRAIHLAVERARLAEQVELASRARLVVREAARELSLDGLLERSQEELVAGFRAIGMWINVLDADGRQRGVVWQQGSQPLDVVPARIAALTRAVADRAWATRQVAIIDRDRPLGPDSTEAERDELVDFMAPIGATTAMLVPLTDGRACHGHMALARSADAPDWSENDVAVALDVGIDLGHAIAHARAFEREQSLVRELKALDDHKNELIRTLSHELKTPLASILGNLELLHDTQHVTADGDRSLAAIARGTVRLSRVVDDLMLLAKIADPANALVCRPVDLAALVDDVLHLTAAVVQQRALRISLDAPERPVLAWGDPAELDRVVTNLISNATKYTDLGGRIEVAVCRQDDRVVITCTDDGIGISVADQERLFREFFRANDPRATGVPGTGLGLAIVERIVRRHGGRIAVRSSPGAGSSFRVSLPGAMTQPTQATGSTGSTGGTGSNATTGSGTTTDAPVEPTGATDPFGAVGV